MAGDWRIVVAKRASRVQRRLGRSLTDAEWSRFENATMGHDTLLVRSLVYRFPNLYRLGVVRPGKLGVVNIAS